MNKKLSCSLALFLIAALLCGCGSSAKTAETAAAPAEAAYDTGTYEEAPAAPIPMADEKAEMNYSRAGGIASNGSVKAESGVSTPMQSEKIIYSAYAELETTTYEETVEAINTMVGQYGGFAESSSISGSNYYQSSRGYKSYRTAEFTLRIPSPRFTEFTSTLPTLGNVPFCNTTSENVTAVYYDVQARMEAYQAQHDRLVEMLAIAESVEDLLAIQSQLSDVDYQIDSLQSRLTNYDRQVSYSTVHLTVQEVEEYTEKPVVVLSYWEKMANGFSRSLKTVGEFFTGLFLWLISNLPEILLWVVILGVVFLLGRRLWDSRDDRRIKRREKAAARREKVLAKRRALSDTKATVSEEGDK